MSPALVDILGRCGEEADWGFRVSFLRTWLQNFLCLFLYLFLGWTKEEGQEEGR